MFTTYYFAIAERAALIEAAICEAKEYASRVQAESYKPVKR